MTQTIADGINNAITQAPENGAFEYQGHWHSWREVAAVMNQIETQLQSAGIAHGTPVAVFLRNRPAQLAAALQMLRSNRCLVTINPFQGPDKLAADVRNLRCAAVIADVEDWTHPVVRDAAAACGSLGIALTQRAELSASVIPELSRLGLGSFHEPLPGTAVLMLTSGTTGPAKRIQLPSKNLEKSFAAAAVYESNRSGSSDKQKAVTILSAPLAHIGGLYFALDAVIAGRPLVMLEKFKVADFTRAMADHRPKMISLPPPALQMILDAEVDPELLSSLKAIRTGAAPLTAELQDAFEQRYRVPLLNVYGATEFAGAVAGWSLQDHLQYRQSKVGAVGRAQPGVELRVVDPQSGEPLPLNTQGVLEVRTAQVDSKKWVRTTDLAELDADGFLYLRGRADDAIIRGGFKVLPREIESLLKRHPSVRDACVVGLPEPRLGAVPVAAVVLRAGAKLSEDELLSFARTHLVAYQVPVKALFVDELPHTPSLKVSQHEVRLLFSAETLSA